MTFRWGFALLLVLHLGLLLRLLVFRFDASIDFEEGFIAFAAQELGDSPREPWTTYVKTPYEGGTFVFSLAARPFVAALGPSWMAVKLTSIAFSIATLAALLILARSWFGDRAALHTGAILATGTPDWLISGLQGVGNAQDGMLLVVALWCVFSAAERRAQTAPSQAVGAFAIGVAAGLALSFSLVALPSVALIVALWLVRRRGRERYAIGVMALGLLAGMTLLLANLAHGIEFYRRRGLLLHQFVGGPTSSLEGLSLLAKPNTMFDSLDAFGADPLGGWSVPLQRIFWIVVGTSWLATSWRARRRDRPGDAWSAAWFGVYAVAFVVHRGGLPSYLLVCVPQAALLVGRTTSSLTGRWSWLGLTAVVALNLAPLHELAGVAPELGGSRVPDLRDRWGHTNPVFTRRHLDTIEKLEARDRLPAFDPNDATNIGAVCGGYQVSPSSISWLAQTQSAAVARRLCEGWAIGRAWAPTAEWTTISVTDLSEMASLTPPELGRVAIRAYARCLGEARWLEGADDVPRELVALAADLDPEGRAALFAGFGEGLGMRWGYRPERYVALLERLPRRAWPAFRSGLAARWSSIEADRARAGQALAQLASIHLVAMEAPDDGDLVLAWAPSPFVQGSVARKGGAIAGRGVDPGFVRYALAVPAGGRHELWAELATTVPTEWWILVGGEPRLGPVHLRPLEPGESRWVQVGVLTLEPGALDLGVMSARAFPEVRGWRLLRAAR